MSPYTLFLTAKEQAALTSIPAVLVAKTVMQTETLAYADTPQRRSIRVRNMQLAHPAFRELKEKFSGGTLAECMKFVAEIPFESVSEDDLTELYFAMGPDVLTSLIAGMLPHVHSDDDVEALMSLSFIRHSLLSSLSVSSVAA